MPESYEGELRIAIAEGLLTRADAEALAEEAREKQQSPLALLVERGRLSEDSLQSLLSKASNGIDTDGATVTGPTMPEARASAGPTFPVAAWDRYTSVRFLGQGGMGHEAWLRSQPGSASLGGRHLGTFPSRTFFRSSMQIFDSLPTRSMANTGAWLPSFPVRFERVMS